MVPVTCPRRTRCRRWLLWATLTIFGYTVHLIRDLQAGQNDAVDHPSLYKAQQVIELTQPLRPQAWVAHLDGRTVRDPNTPADQLARWQMQTSAAVNRVAAWAGSPARLAIENLEGYPPEFVTPVVASTGASRCVDVGHLWLDGHDPLPCLHAALPRLRVVHLHGVRERDHLSLAHMAPTQIDPVIGLLLGASYRGVVTMEVFGEEDFWSSLHALVESVERIERRGLSADLGAD